MHFVRKAIRLPGETAVIAGVSPAALESSYGLVGLLTLTFLHDDFPGKNGKSGG